MYMIMKASVFATMAVAACGAPEANKSASTEGEAGTQAAAAAESGAQTHSATGTVTGVSETEATISHGEIKSIGWPAMTMAFTVDDPVLLKDIKAGDRVSFAFSKSGSVSTLTSITKQ